MRLISLSLGALLTLSLLGCQSAPKLASPNREPQSVNAEWKRRFSNPAVLAEFSAELKAELECRVRTFPRAISAYHYTQRSFTVLDIPRGESASSAYTTPIELTPPEAVDYYRANAESFETDPKASSFVGAGIYAASDPVQSENYAEKPWALLEILVPAGAKYLDLRPRNSLIFSKEFVVKWFNRENGFTRPEERFITVLEVPELRTQVIAALKALEVDAIAYDWATQTVTICREMKNSQATSFNFINPKFLDEPGRFRVYVQKLEAQPSAEKRKAYSRILDLIQASWIRFESASRSGSAPYPAWSVGSSPIRALTHGWAKTLNRKSTLESVAKNPDDIEKFYANFVTDSSEKPKNALLELDPLQLTQKRKSSSSPSYVYEAMNVLKEADPSAYANRVAEIRNSTFGCSEKYPEENVTPSRE